MFLWLTIDTIDQKKKKSLTHGAITSRKNETHCMDWYQCQSTAGCAQLCPAVPSFSWLSAHFQLNKYFIPIYCLLVHLLQQKPWQPEPAERSFFITLPNLLVNYVLANSVCDTGRKSLILFKIWTYVCIDLYSNTEIFFSSDWTEGDLLPTGDPGSRLHFLHHFSLRSMPCIP
jgi:hypothetical protein